MTARLHGRAGARITKSLAGALVVTLVLAATSAGEPGPVATVPHHPVSHVSGPNAPVPLNDLGQGRYLGRFKGGLYLNGKNRMPKAHLAEGRERADAIRPLGPDGAPSADGKIVLLSVGMSNTSGEFCGNQKPPCKPGSFMARAAALDSLNDDLVIVNGAIGGMPALAWDSPDDNAYDIVRDERLAPAGVTEQQVQAVWLKQANAGPTVSLPDEDADAFRLEAAVSRIVRALEVRYPNLQQVFISSRIYAGYATSGLNPEPYAYESGFSVKWVVRAQIKQMKRGGEVVDQRAGDLNYDTVAPWIAWGPYLWADGTIPRSDGLTWERDDFREDGTHPSLSGAEKVGGLLLDFFVKAKTTKVWFLED